jgi:diguanylate cyclase
MVTNELICLAAAGVLSSALLWLAAEIASLAPARPAPIGATLTGVSVVLAASGLWWPVHLMPAEGTLAAAGGAQALLAWLPPLLLSLLAAATAATGRAGHLPAALASGTATLAMAYGVAMLTAPGLLRLSHAEGQIGAGAATLVLGVAMVIVHVQPGSPRAAAWARFGAALSAASVICVSAASAANLRAVEAASWWPELAMVSAFTLLSAVMLFLLRQSVDSPTQALIRPARTASVDNLTGLPTRLYFEGRLASAAKKAQDQRSKLAVFFIDLDGFKPVNDTYGHNCGDRVLEQVGRRLKAISRGADVAARVGGDEFLMLMTDASSQEVVAQVGQRLINALSRPYRIDEREVGISCSVGIAMYPDGCSQRKLIARADVAMYAAKRAGGSRLCFYAPDMDTDAKHNFDMVRDLRQAIVKNELELYFQPKIDAHSGKVTAAEALLRWQHPTLGLLMPEQFVTLAERSGLIGPLGNWVIEASCKQARAWRDKGLRMRVAINLSAHQMRQDDIAERIAETLKRHRIHPSLLTCEITESAAMEDTRATQVTFKRLGELGTHLSIDDFGTGYSSLSYLRQLPAEELKIDRSFVLDLEHSADARAVVDAVVKLAHALGLKVVAEGVETPRQQQILIELGCDELQGYLFARPMTARALLLWALGDREESAAFRNSLFGETRQTTMLPPASTVTAP